MSAQLARNSKATLSPSAREVAATVFRHPRLVVASFGLVLLTTMCWLAFSPRYESHFNVLLRRGRSDPLASSQPPSAIDFTRSEISEEELNSEVELLRDEDLLREVVRVAGLISSDGPLPDRRREIERAVRKVSRQLEDYALIRMSRFCGTKACRKNRS